MSEQKPVGPLIPLDQLKRVVRGLIAVPKSDLEKPDPEKPKKPRRVKNA